MGNYRFRLSDMMLNAWFYKLKDMSRSKTAHNTKKRLPSCSSSTTTYVHHQKQQPFHQYSQSRNSYYYTPRIDYSYNSPRNPKSSDTRFPPATDPPRKSSKRSRTNRKTIYKPSPKQHPSNSTATLYSACTDHHHHPGSTQVQDHFFHSPPADATSPEPDHHKSPSTESTHSLNELTSWSCSSCSCRVSSSATDIIIDMNDKSSSSHPKKVDNFEGFDSILEVDLPPILTKPPKPNNSPQEAPPKLSKKSSPRPEEKESCNSLPIKKVKEYNTAKTTQPRKSVSYSTGMKLRSNSPRIELSKNGVGHGHTGNGRKSLKSSQRKSFLKSCAIVKSSFDPQKDFRESMMEMIIENNIRASKDLEELLACYLTLNSDEYHDLIVKAFEQIWFILPSF